LYRSAPELSPLIGEEFSKETPSRDPFREHRASNGVSCLVRDGNEFNPPSEAINHDKNVDIAAFRLPKRPHQVCRDPLKPWSEGNRLQKSCSLLLCFFGLFANYARFDPRRATLIKIGPPIAFRESPIQRTLTIMVAPRCAVINIQDRRPKFPWDHGLAPVISQMCIKGMMDQKGVGAFQGIALRKILVSCKIGSVSFP